MGGLRSGTKALLPGGAMLGAAALAALAPALHAPLSQFLTSYGLLPLAAPVLLALVFRRGRPLLAACALALAYLAVDRWGALADEQPGRFALAATALLLPLDLAWASLARERGVLSRAGVLRLGLLAAQPALAALAWQAWLPALLALPETRLVPLALPGALAQPGLLAFAAALVLTAVQVFRLGSPIEAGLMWSVVAALAALAWPDADPRLMLATAATILTVALLLAASATLYRDALTGLPARRAFDEALAALPAHASLAIVDIDHFKSINDTYGHDTGDQVLRMVAARLAATGGGGRAFRVGGEEFAVVFAGCGIAQARAHLEALRHAIEESSFTLRAPDRPPERPRAPAAGGRRTISVTVSLGAAERESRSVPATTLVESADRALYAAKEAGRNRLCVAATGAASQPARAAGSSPARRPAPPARRPAPPAHRSR